MNAFTTNERAACDRDPLLLQINHQTKAAYMTVEQHFEAMMLEADDLDSVMNNAGFYYLGHLVREERARVSLAFAAMVCDYAKRHGLNVRNPHEDL